MVAFSESDIGLTKELLSTTVIGLSRVSSSTILSKREPPIVETITIT